MSDNTIINILSDKEVHEMNILDAGKHRASYKNFFKHKDVRQHNDLTGVGRLEHKTQFMSALSEVQSASLGEVIKEVKTKNYEIQQLIDRLEKKEQVDNSHEYLNLWTLNSHFISQQITHVS